MARPRSAARPRGRRDDRPRVVGAGRRGTARRGTTRRLSQRPALPAAANGALAAGTTLLLTFGAVLMVVAVGWVFAADHTSLRGMVAFAIYTWLAAHLLPVQVADATWWLPPLLLTAGVIAVGMWAGREAVRRGVPTSRAGMRDFALAAVGTYAGGAILLAALSATAEVTVPLFLTPFAAAAVFAVGLALGVARATRTHVRFQRQIPVRIRAELSAAATGIGVLLAGSAVLFAVAVVLSGDRIAESLDSIQPGISGTALIVLLCLIYLPTMLVWVAAFALGPGFSVGTGTIVAPWEVDMGEVPAVPLLVALPTTHSWFYLVALLVPIAAVFAARRALPVGAAVQQSGAVISLARTAGFAAAGMALLSILADGGIGGRLALLGPAPLLVAAATGAWFIVVFAVVEGWQALRLRRRRRRNAGAAVTSVDDKQVEAIDVGTER